MYAEDDYMAENSENIINEKQDVKGKLNKPTKRVKKQKASKKRPFWLQLFICLFILAILCIGVTYNYIIDEFNAEESQYDVVIDEESAVAVRIPYGATTNDIIKILKKERLIDNEFLFKVISKFEGYDGQYMSGSHLLNKDMELIDIMKVLSDKPESIRVTFPEGFTTKKIAARLENNGLANQNEFIKAVNDFKDFESYKFFQELDTVEGRDIKLEGYLFPDTYEFDMMVGDGTAIKVMLNRFDQLFLPEYYEQAEKIGLTVDEVVILASIIEKEAAMPSERKIISGVFHNRLKNPKEQSLKKLQSCATLQYIIERDTGVIKEIITREDEAIVDVYNTYLHEGLPPGPICSPSLASIKAALYPQNHDYYYFSVKNDGSGEHNFAKTYNEHLKNQR